MDFITGDTLLTFDPKFDNDMTKEAADALGLGMNND